MGIRLVSTNAKPQCFFTSFREYLAFSSSPISATHVAEYLEPGGTMADWQRTTKELARHTYEKLLLDVTHWLADDYGRRLSPRSARVEFGHLASVLSRRIARSASQLGGTELEALTLFPNEQHFSFALEAPANTRGAYDLITTTDFGTLIDLGVYSQLSGKQFSIELKVTAALPADIKEHTQVSNFSLLESAYKFFHEELKPFTSRNSYFISSTYLGRAREIGLALLLGQAPLLRELEDGRIRRVGLPNSFKLNLPFSIDELALALFKILLPAHYRLGSESWASHAKKVGLPHSPKVVFTSGGYAFDDELKRHASEYLGTCKYVVGQHGNNYGANSVTEILPELESADLFLSWGSSSFASNITFFGQLTPPMPRRRHTKVPGALLLIRSSMNYWTQGDPDRLDFLYRTKLAAAIESISGSGLRCLIKPPPGGGPASGSFAHSLAEHFPNVHVVESGMRLKGLVKEGYLPIFTYDSTGMLEAASGRQPFLFLNLDQSEATQACKENYAALESAGLSTCEAMDTGPRTEAIIERLKDLGPRAFDDALAEFSSGLCESVWFRTIRLSRLLRKVSRSLE